MRYHSSGVRRARRPAGSMSHGTFCAEESRAVVALVVLVLLDHGAARYLPWERVQSVRHPVRRSSQPTDGKPKIRIASVGLASVGREYFNKNSQNCFLPLSLVRSSARRAIRRARRGRSSMRPDWSGGHIPVPHAANTTCTRARARHSTTQERAHRSARAQQHWIPHPPHSAQPLCTRCTKTSIPATTLSRGLTK